MLPARGSVENTDQVQADCDRDSEESDATDEGQQAGRVRTLDEDEPEQTAEDLTLVDLTESGDEEAQHGRHPGVGPRPPRLLPLTSQLLVQVLVAVRALGRPRLDLPAAVWARP